MIDNVKNGRDVVKGEVKSMFGPDQGRANPCSDRAVEEAVLLALKGIRFGSVEIIVHDSRVVQIERKEKMRMEHP